MKLLCLGDSLTETYGINPDLGWVNLLRKELKIDIINAGICGDTTTGMLSRCQSLVEKHMPTHLIILGGTNDLWFGLKDEYIISNIQAISRHAACYSVNVLMGLPTKSFNLNESNFVQENYSDRITHFRMSLKQYCKSQEKGCIDFNRNMKKEHFLNDGLHPSELGQKIMMKNVLEVLKYNIST